MTQAVLQCSILKCREKAEILPEMAMALNTLLYPKVSYILTETPLPKKGDGLGLSLTKLSL